MIGKNLSHYTITEQIGSGGMGIVYKAQDTKLNRSVALKFLPPELTRDPEAKQRFLREAHAISSLDHPNICTLFEIEETPEGHMYMAMAYYEGETLREKIKRGPLEPEEAVRITLQVIEGLSHAHARGVVHRDIKPANIAVTKEGIVKILDFGLAKLATSPRLTRTGATAGTASYMSPEQARGENVDHRSDIWSLGIVLYEMLTGTLPFRGEFEHAVVYSILNEQPARLSTIRHNLPPMLQAAITRALQKEASDRYQRVDEMAGDLKAANSATWGRARYSILPLIRSRIRNFAVLAAVVLVILAGGLLMLRGGSDGENRIVVLPFKTPEGTAADQNLCDELTEQMISELSRHPAVSVLSRTSSMKLKGTSVDLKKIGEELDVQYVIEGIVRISKTSVRVSALLSQASSDRCLWAETYLRDSEVDKDVPKEVAAAIANEVDLKLQPAKEAAVQR